MTDELTTIHERDEALAAQGRDDHQDALQEALDTHRELKHADVDLQRAADARDAARRRYDAACAKLIPFHRLAQQVAA